MMRGYEDVSSARDEHAKSVDNFFLCLLCGQGCCSSNAKSYAEISGWTNSTMDKALPTLQGSAGSKAKVRRR